MDLKALHNKLKGSISNYKYVFIVLAVGLLLMLIPNGKHAEKDNEAKEVPLKQISQEEKIAGILKHIQGVGEVQVLLSTENTGETVYQTDSDTSTGNGSSNQRDDTVILTDADRNQSALIKSSGSPIYRGAVVVCQGGDKAAVKLAVTQAVIKATGLSAERICVLKMK